MTDAAATETEITLEPHYQFESRMATLTREATEAAASAAAAEAAASQEVTTLRGDFRLGLVARGAWDAASKRLSKIQTARADADATLAAVGRQVGRERLARQEAEKVLARRERVDRDALRAASMRRANELWDQVFAALDAIDALPGLAPLHSAGRAYDMALGSLNQLRRIFSGK